MSSSIAAGYAKRLSVLERSKSEIDPLELAFDTLTDTELGILEEFMGLVQAGYTQQQIEGKISRETYELALEIVEKVNMELVRLEEI